MMTRTLLVSTAVIVALTAVPTMAELQSSPAEKAQTRALNSSVSKGIYTSPRVLNGGKIAQNDQSSQYGSDRGPQSGHGQYGPESAAPNGREAHARANLDPNDFVALKTVDPDRLDDASVQDPSGVAIGHVTDIKLARDGTPAEVTIELNNERYVRLSESALRFNPNDRTLLTNVDIGELKSASSEYSGE